MGLGMCYQSAGDIPKALDVFEEALKKEPIPQLIKMVLKLRLNRIIQFQREKNAVSLKKELVQFLKIAPENYPQLDKVKQLLNQVESVLKEQEQKIKEKESLDKKENQDEK